MQAREPYEGQGSFGPFLEGLVYRIIISTKLKDHLFNADLQFLSMPSLLPGFKSPRPTSPMSIQFTSPILIPKPLFLSHLSPKSSTSVSAFHSS